MNNGNLNENQGNLFLDDNSLGMVKQAIDFLSKPYESESAKDRPIYYYWRGISNDGGYERIKNKNFVDFKKAFEHQMKVKMQEIGKLHRLDQFINERKYEIKKIRESIYQVGDNVLKCAERDDFKKLVSRAEHPTNALAITIVKTLREVTEYLYFANDVDFVLSHYVNEWYKKNIEKYKKEWGELGKKYPEFRQFDNLKWVLNYYDDKGLSKLLQGYQTLKVYYEIVPNKMSRFWEYLSDYVYMVQIDQWKFNWTKFPVYVGAIALGFAFAELVIRISQGTRKKRK